MVERRREIETYRLNFRPFPATTSFLGGFRVENNYGYLKLSSKENDTFFYISIVDNSVTSLQASQTYVFNSKWYGYAVIKQENLHNMLDLLRNEKPIRMCLYEGGGAGRVNCIFTDQEPVGEGEKIEN